MTETLAERLARYADILDLIDKKREATASPALGSAIERFILESQFVELGLTAPAKAVVSARVR